MGSFPSVLRSSINESIYPIDVSLHPVILIVKKKQETESISIYSILYTSIDWVPISGLFADCSPVRGRFTTGHHLFRAPLIILGAQIGRHNSGHQGEDRTYPLAIEKVFNAERRNSVVQHAICGLVEVPRYPAGDLTGHLPGRPRRQAAFADGKP